MEKQIIDGPLTIDQKLELETSMYYDIKWTMYIYGPDSWFKECSVLDFYSRSGRLEDIIDRDGCKKGKGIVTQKQQYILDEKTAKNLEEVFDKAMEKVCNERGLYDFRARFVFEY